MFLSKLQLISLVILTVLLTNKLATPSKPNTDITQNTLAEMTATVSPKPEPTQSQIAPNSSLQTEIILREISNLRKDIEALSREPKQASTSNLLPTPSGSPTLGGMVKINNSKWKQVDAFEKPLSSSKIVGTIIYDNIYFYQQKQTGWYQISLDNGDLAWVQSQFLKEFP